MYQIKQLRDEDLDLFIESGVNVILSGRHGVGKTTMIVSAFERHNLNYRYFSAPTMDPWVDFVGVPRETTDAKGNPKLELIRPDGFHDGAIEALMFDELNRAKDKVRNAVMELIQFGSINGHKFPNLKFIWAAVNPEDDEDDLSYDVERLDPAQLDRFQIQIELPYEPSLDFFTSKHGEAGRGAVEWWNELDDKAKLNCSPRRLDEALDAYKKSIDLRFLLSGDGMNIDKLRQKINIGSYDEVLERLHESQDHAAIKRQFNNINFVTDVIDTILDDDEYVTTFLPYLQKDRVSAALCHDDKEIRLRVMKFGDAKVITSAVAQIVSANSAPKYVITELMKEAQARGLDVITAVEFSTTLDQAISDIPKKDDEDEKETLGRRFKRMLGVNSNFSYNASLDVYEKCMRFVAMIVAEADDKRLVINNSPEGQLMSDVLNHIQRVTTEKHNTNAHELWTKVKAHREIKKYDSAQIKKVEKFIKDVVG